MSFEWGDHMLFSTTYEVKLFGTESELIWAASRQIWQRCSVLTRGDKEANAFHMSSSPELLGCFHRGEMKWNRNYCSLLLFTGSCLHKRTGSSARQERQGEMSVRCKRWNMMCRVAGDMLFLWGRSCSDCNIERGFADCILPTAMLGLFVGGQSLELSAVHRDTLQYTRTNWPEARETVKNTNTGVRDCLRTHFSYIPRVVVQLH